MVLKVNLIAEKFIGEANGVYTAYVEAADALKKTKNVVLTVFHISDCR
jgi:hypothetical protein